ncbi:TPA: GTP-binding protein [Kluyvera intermedia]|uniref:GTPase family protein n=1 Tax=Phytobacter TaxID=447792 RepID=UPI000D50023E|nr:GTPase [Phytobacter sp. SCO41]HAT2610091.1 GTP-binding protein [Kluyvera intermedia]
MRSQNFFDKLIEKFQNDKKLSDNDKAAVFKNLASLKDTKVNILITGATGSGKSSTINALFDFDKAKVGTGVDPETMSISKYELDNIVLFDSPGLGDGKEADRRHAKNIINKLVEKDDNGDLLIDLVLVILDGSSRDLGTSFELINNVIIPNLGDDHSRLLVAINQADMAMKGKHWDYNGNIPEPKLIDFLNEKVLSTRKRIKEATGVDVTPIYYSAGYKDENEEQKPYNLSKLFAYILRKTKEEKRIVFANDVNKKETMWEKDDKLEDYQKEIKETFIESLTKSVSKGASSGSDIGGSIGGIFGKSGEVLGRVVGGVAGGIFGFLGGLFS